MSLTNLPESYIDLVSHDNQYTFTGLDGGLDYTVYVIDANQCSVESTMVSLTDPIDFSMASLKSEYNCELDSYDISISLDLNFDTSTVDYMLFDSVGNVVEGPINSNIFTHIMPNNGYSIFVTDNKSTCSYIMEDIDLAPVEPLSIQGIRSGINKYTVKASGGLPSYEYSLEDGVFSSNEEFKFTQTGTYILKAKDAYGCIAETLIDVEFIDITIPNFFTPNGDSNNDYWYPKRLEYFPDAVVNIYDRYGRLLITFHGDKIGWDGSYQKEALPTGDYWYVLNLNDEDNTSELGHFTLYR